MAKIRPTAYFEILYTPLLSEAFVKYRGGLLSTNWITRDTDLVIDGFPRSGNTYCRYAFDFANDHRYRVASHLHTPRSIKRAARLGVPRLVLIRDPHDAVASLVECEPDLGIERAAKLFHRYYHSLYWSRTPTVVALFDSVIADFGKVVGRVNDAYGTDFIPPGGNRDEVEATMRKAGVGKRKAAERRPTVEVLANMTPAEKAAMTRAYETFELFIGLE